MVQTQYGHFSEVYTVHRQSLWTIFKNLFLVFCLLLPTCTYFTDKQTWSRAHALLLHSSQVCMKKESTYIVSIENLMATNWNWRNQNHQCENNESHEPNIKAISFGMDVNCENWVFFSNRIRKVKTLTVAEFVEMTPRRFTSKMNPFAISVCWTAFIFIFIDIVIARGERILRQIWLTLRH